MERLKRLAKKLLFPHPVLMVFLVPAAAALLIYVLSVGDQQSLMAYGAYFFSAYALTILCAGAPKLLPFIRRVKRENKQVRRYLEDVNFRMKLSLYSSLSINTLYAMMQFGLGFYHHSVWFYALAAYYAILAVIRYFLLKETRKEIPGTNYFMELLHYRFCGIFLLLMNLALAVIVFYIVWQNRGFSHHEILTIAMAAYTFFTMAMAVINLIRYRRYHSPVMSAAKALSFAAALVSILSLETALLSAFGQENSLAFRQIMTALTGGAVCIIVLAMAVMMIVRSTKEINRLKGGSSNGT